MKHTTDLADTSIVTRGFWICVFILAVPCSVINSKIILSTLFWHPPNRPKDFLLVNLAFGGMIFYASIIAFNLENYTTVYTSDIGCGIRAMHIRLGIIIVTYTLARIVQQNRINIYKNPLYQHMNPKNSLTSAILINLCSVIILIPTAVFRSFDLETGKCLKGFVINEVVDWIYRFCIFLIVNIIPACVLFKEMKAIFDVTKNHQTSTNSEFGAFVRQKKVNTLRTSLIFSSIFFFFALPCTMLDVTDSPAIQLPPNIRFYRTILRSVAYMLTFLTINVLPVYMWYANKIRTSNPEI